jgi:ADP-ribose pyrophosphatase YjhB (NUDIX family)
MAVSISATRRALEPLLRRLFHFYWRFSRGMTLGVRGVVIDAEGRVFLIKHSYVPGWHLPGGGVEPGETIVDALTRELREEGNIELTAPAELRSLHFQSKVSRRDHVALFVVRSFVQSSPPTPGYEIVAHGFFRVDAMPGDTTASTRARIAEVLLGTPSSHYW